MEPEMNPEGTMPEAAPAAPEMDAPEAPMTPEGGEEEAPVAPEMPQDGGEGESAM